MTEPQINAFYDAQRRISEALTVLRLSGDFDLVKYKLVMHPSRFAAIVRDAPLAIGATTQVEHLWGFEIELDEGVDIALRHEVRA